MNNDKKSCTHAFSLKKKIYIYIYIYIFNEKANRILKGSSGYKNSKNVHLGAS